MTWTIRKEAQISACGQYRWSLRRTWPGGNGRVICFVGLNPSIADADIDDPSVRRMIGFAQAWGFSTLSVRNLFAYRATNPDKLLRAPVDAVGGRLGDMAVLTAVTADVTVAAWGAHPAGHARATEVCGLIAYRYPAKQLMCLGTTKGGHPRHPLSVAKTQTLLPYA